MVAEAQAARLVALVAACAESPSAPQASRLQALQVRARPRPPRVSFFPLHGRPRGKLFPGPPLQVIAAVALTQPQLFLPGGFAERAPMFLVSLCGAGGGAHRWLHDPRRADFTFTPAPPTRLSTSATPHPPCERAQAALRATTMWLTTPPSSRKPPRTASGEGKRTSP